ncbi:MAG: hypothetical protein JKY22_12235 [Flavobacteriaceae bacterium]|nr:hypothetical protein [Flavobacteriaceae bacterium]
MNEDDELGVFFAQKINVLAALFYQSQNRVFNPKIDFKNSSHPEEIGCWNKAIIAHSFINEDTGLLKHQVLTAIKQ